MNVREFGLILLLITCVVLVMIIARLILGILSKVRCGRDPAGRLSLHVIIASAASLLSLFSSSDLIIRYFVTSQKALINYMEASGYIRIISFVLNAVGYYLLADYCRKKYGAKIRIAVMALILAVPVVNFVLVRLAIGIVSADRNYELYNLITTLPQLLTAAAVILLTVVFIRGRSKEDVFRSIYVLFIIIDVAIVFQMLRNILAYRIPEIIYYLTDIVFALPPLALAIYVFVCSGRVRSKASKGIDKD